MMLQVVQLPTEPMIPPPWVTLPPPAVVLIMLAVVGGAVLVLWPLARALARRLEGGGRDVDTLRQELAALRQHVHDLEAGQQRVLELEERLDFAERMLAAGPERARPGGVA